MNINRFMSGHMDAMARSNRFDIEIYGPAGIRSRGIRCTSVTTPSKTITTVAHNYGGATPDTKYPQKVEYENVITCSFMLDHTYEDRQMFEIWQGMIYDDAYNLSYPESYYGTIKITQLGVDGFALYSVVCHDAYVTKVGGLGFDASTEGTIQKFEVEFAFRTWSSEFENTPSGLLGGLFKKFSRKIAGKVKKKFSDKLFG